MEETLAKENGASQGTVMTIWVGRTDSRSASSPLLLPTFDLTHLKSYYGGGLAACAGVLTFVMEGHISFTLQPERKERTRELSNTLHQLVTQLSRPLVTAYGLVLTGN